MHTLNLSSSRLGLHFALACLAVLTCQGVAAAASGTWNVDSGGDYNSSGNWQGGVIASGAGSTANFNTLDVTGDHEVTLNAPLTIGNLVFGDTNLGSGGSWGITTPSVETSIVTLDNGGSSPTITANPISSASFDNSFIGTRLAGTAGFTKLGAGTLELGGHGTTDQHTITGPINISEGRLRTLAPLSWNSSNYTLGSGATFETVAFPLANGTGSAAAGTITIAAGQTATVRQTTAGRMIGISGAGSTLNYVLANTGLNEMHGDWGLNGQLAELNVSTDASMAPGVFRIDRNRNANGFFNLNSFLNTRVNLDNVGLRVRTNSNGNTVFIGQLAGTSTATIRGGEGGSAARYEIGAMNTNSTFNGTIDGTGGISINKVGTGTLTLAGPIQGDGTNSSLALSGQPLGRQGGVVRVTAGTLKLTGASAIPGGFGAVMTTIDVLPGATFDVSSTPATFSTSALQKLQGGGTILGTYNHDQGQIRPADVGAATPANEENLSAGVTATAGTITFNGNVQLSGGDVIYDISPSPASGNDLVQVNGTTTLTSGKIVPNFITGAAPAAGLTYTVLKANEELPLALAFRYLINVGSVGQPRDGLSGNNLQFTTPAGGLITADVVWTGSVNGTWDVEATQNWNNGGNADRYFNFDDVTFNDSATNKTITLNSLANPATMEINNSTAYSFTGSGAIFGPTGLTKTGAGPLTMQLNNAFTGTASVTGSTVTIGAFANGLGAGPLVLNNATVISTVSVGNSTLDIPTGMTSTIQIDGAIDAAGASNIPSLTGDGTLNLTSTVTNKFFGTFNTAGFTGTLNVAPSGAASTLGRVRIRGAQTDLSGAVVNLTSSGLSNQQGAAENSSVTVAIGEIHADASSPLMAFEGGSVPPDIVWQIGALNTNSDVAGTIVDGLVGTDASVASLTKVGNGTLTLTGANTYTGNTTVNGGTLSINSSYLADMADVLISSGAKLDLNFGSSDTIRYLYLGGVPQSPGTYGLSALGSSFFLGTGSLMVSALGPVLGVTGDYNDDGIVDAADYTLWRDNLGADGAALLHRDPANMGAVSQADYDSWKANFGAVAGAGAGAASLAGAVPEPSSGLLACLAVCGAVGAVNGRRRRRSE